MSAKSLLSSAAIVMLMSCSAVAAQDQGERGKGQGQSDSHGKSNPEAKPQERQNQQGPSRGRAEAAPQGNANAQPRAQAQAAPQERVNRQGPQRAQAAPQSNANAQPRAQARAVPQERANQQAPSRARAEAAPQTRSADFQRQAAPQVQPQRQPAGPSGRNSVAATASHVQQRSQWTSGHPDWNRSTVWQRNSNWWRSDARFRDYTGIRANFFFAPGFGYYSVPAEYRDRSWQTGAYLPLFFLQYAVNDYQAYGLPPPPYGCSWVWVNTGVFLIDRSDGYILDEISNVW